MKYWEIYVFCMDNGYDTIAQTLQCILWPALRSSELDIQYRREFLGSGDGAVVRVLASHQFDPGMSLLLVLALLRGFSSGFSSFPPPTKKTAFPNSNSTRLEGLNENPLFLSKYFNSKFYFSFCNKDRLVLRGQKKVQMLLVSRWTLKRRILEYGLLDDFGWATRRSRRTFQDEWSINGMEEGEY